MRGIRRRDFNACLVAAFATTLPAIARADDEDDSDTMAGPATDDTGTDEIPPDEPDQNGLEQRGLEDDYDPMGLNCRAPSLSRDQLPPMEMLGTDSSYAPMPIAVEPGYFADENNLGSLQDSDKSILDDAIEKLKELGQYIESAFGDIVKSADVSIGQGVGEVGGSPAFVLVQTDAKGDVAETVGAGETVGVFGAGVFGTHTDSASGEGSFSGGVYAGVSSKVAGDAALMVSGGSSNGDIIVDVGVIVENPTGESIEYSWEFNITQPMAEFFREIFGGLSDYRNYQDPLLY